MMLDVFDVFLVSYFNYNLVNKACIYTLMFELVAFSDLAFSIHYMTTMCSIIRTTTTALHVSADNLQLNVDSFPGIGWTF